MADYWSIVFLTCQINLILLARRWWRIIALLRLLRRLLVLWRLLILLLCRRIIILSGWLFLDHICVRQYIPQTLFVIPYQYHYHVNDENNCNQEGYPSENISDECRTHVYRLVLFIDYLYFHNSFSNSGSLGAALEDGEIHNFNKEAQ